METLVVTVLDQSWDNYLEFQDSANCLLLKTVSLFCSFKEGRI